MMFETSSGMEIRSDAVINYLGSLVNKFFKILPMREESEPSLQEYIMSFQRELTGFGNLVSDIRDDELFVSILSILQYLSDNACNESTVISDIRREVFHAISICNKLKSKYLEGGVAK